MSALAQQLFRRKGVKSYVEGEAVGEGELPRTLGLLPLIMLGIGGTVGRVFSSCSIRRYPRAGPP